MKLEEHGSHLVELEWEVSSGDGGAWEIPSGVGGVCIVSGGVRGA